MFTTNIINYFFFFDKAGCTRCFFRKPTSPPLNLKRSSKTHQSSLALKGGSTSHLGLLPSGKKRKPLLSIVFTTPSVPLVGDRNVALNHFILWLADHQRSTPAAELRFAGCDRLAELIACSLLKGCLLVAYSLLSLLLARYRKAACSLLAERLLIPCRRGALAALFL